MSNSDAIQRQQGLPRSVSVPMSVGLIGMAVLVSICSCKKAVVSETNEHLDAVSPAGEREAVASIDGLTPEQSSLDKDKQKYIWDAEHATHLIEHRLGVRFRQALKSNAADSLADCLRDDASVELMEWRNAPKTQIGSVTSTDTANNAASTKSDKLGLSKWLLDLFNDQSELSKYSMRVLAIDHADDQAEVWNAHILLSGQGKNLEGGPKLVQSKHRVQFGWNEVDDLEKASPIRAWRVESVQVRDTPKPLMTEVTRAAGLHRVPVQDNWNLPDGRPPQMLRFQMAVADFDRDGFLDVALSSAGNNFLLRFSKGKFVPVTESLGIHSASRGQHVDISTSWIDYDNDGFPDLILGGRLYHNQQGRRFEDVTAQCGIQFDPHHMGCAVADFDLDGLTDVYFIYAHDSEKQTSANKAWIGDEQSGGSNRLWKNQGDGTFADVTEHAGVEGGKRQSFAANWLFADDDRFPDLYVANDFGKNSLFRNRGDGTFEDISDKSGTADFATSMGVASGDLDNDGRPEIYVANMYSKMGRRIVGQVNDSDYPAGIYPRLQGACAGSRLYRSGAGSADPSYSEFSEIAGVNQVGWAYAPAMVDLNNDGLLDLYATCGFLSVDRHKPDG